tara:strand:- start:915 stop:1628 length:714 start_codon:yes stop_codon:yes gene_type:complete
MLVTGIILALGLIGAYIFLGMKLSESIIHSDIKIFFWALYIVTLLTIINLSMSLYFYSSLKDKKGPLGSRGTKGRMGDRGMTVGCSGDCKSKSVQIMIEEALQNHYNESDITPQERKIICNLINNEEPVVTTSTSGERVEVKGNKDIINGTNNAGAGWSFNDYKIFKDNFETKLSGSTEFKNYKNFKQRLAEQEQPESTLKADLEVLIVDSSTHQGNDLGNLDAAQHLNNNTTQECV